MKNICIVVMWRNAPSCCRRLELRVQGLWLLFVCPEAGSLLFGWTNEEPGPISYITTNSELFTGYFIIMTLVTMFYREAYPDTLGLHKINDLVENVTSRLAAWGGWKTASGPENQFDFVESAESGKDSRRSGRWSGARNKIACENICRF